MASSTIWKFPLSPDEIDEAERTGINMPVGARILSAGVQGANLCLWAEVDPSQAREPRRILVLGTGHTVPPVSKRFINTVFMDGLVFHVFEVIQ